MNKFISVFILLFTGCNHPPGSSSPFSASAENDLSTFQVADGFKIELIASEPLIHDPVDMMIDEYGRMYVVEMAGVPFNKSGVGKVILLSDRNGDGKMDSAKVFADSLILPSGIMRWKNGVIVTDAPNVYYMEDTNSDGVADVRRILLTGFDTSNLEANVNNPKYGLDNWIYLADLPVAKSEIYFADDPAGTRLPESSLRFLPESRQMEVLSGQTQFGQTWDAWGHHLMVSNSNHIYQNVVPARYLQRNTDMAISNATETLADHREVYSTTKNPEYQMLTDVGVFTSACGNSAYLGGVFPKDYNENVTFVCEPVSNLVHADRLVPNGITPKAKRILGKKDFLTSADPYTRPVNTYIGPDGALYVVDFYRQVIEGPEFMAKEVLDTVNLYNGNNKGRIYRISAKEADMPQWTKGLRMGNEPGESLVQTLADKNIWWRLNAQRLLVDRNDKKIIPALSEMILKNKSPLGRLHALWTLEGMHALTADLIGQALTDAEPGIRENAIQLAELHLKDSPGLSAPLFKLKSDTSAAVRFQLLLTLGNIQNPEADKIRQQLLFKDVNDKWVQIAALSASSSQAIELLNAVLTNYDNKNSTYASLVQRLGAIIGTNQPAGTVMHYIQSAQAIGSETVTWQAALLEGLSQGLMNRHSLPAGLEKSIPELVQNSLSASSAPIRKSSLQLMQTIGLPEGKLSIASMRKACQLAGDKKLPVEKRVSAINFLALRSPAPYTNFLKTLIDPREPPLIQISAVAVLMKIPGTAITVFLLSKWDALSSGVRGTVIDGSLSNDDRIRLLLDALQAGKINQGDVNWVQSVRLRSLKNIPLRMRAREIFSKKDDKLKSILNDYQSALTLRGNTSIGKNIFQDNCAVCHQVEGKIGRAYGPDLGTVHAWAPADIMTNILDPNRSIAHGYDTWELMNKKGEVIQGIITNETPTAVTITDANGKVNDISRRDITSLKALGISVMPVGWEDKISKQQMADLLAFLKQGNEE